MAFNSLINNIRKNPLARYMDKPEEAPASPLQAPKRTNPLAEYMDKPGASTYGSDYETMLTSEEEKEFGQWKSINAPLDSGQDYDYRGAWQQGATADDEKHWPDTFKKPTHPTFSTDSKYAKDAPEWAGYWEGENFTPSKLQQQKKEDAHFANDPMIQLLNKSLNKSARPMLGHVIQDSARQTKLAIKDTANPLVTGKVLGGALQQLPSQLASTILQGAQGMDGADVNKDTLTAEVLEYAKRSSQDYNNDVSQMEGGNIAPFIPITVSDVSQLPESMAYSIASMGAGLAVGVPIGLTGAIPVALAAGTSASGLAAYNMSTFSIMQSFLENANEGSIATRGRPINEKEQDDLKKAFNKLAIQYGLWEAIPEAMSNLAFASIIGGPLAKVMTGMGMKGAFSKVLGGAASMYGEEIATETIAQYNQARIEETAGLRAPGTGQLTWWQAMKEVAPQTFLLSTILGGTGVSVMAAKNRIFASLEKEVGKENASEIEELFSELDETKDFGEQLDDQAELYGQKVEDIILKQFESEKGPQGIVLEEEPQGPQGIDLGTPASVEQATQSPATALTPEMQGIALDEEVTPGNESLEGPKGIVQDVVDPLAEAQKVEEKVLKTEMQGKPLTKAQILFKIDKALATAPEEGNSGGIDFKIDGGVKIQNNKPALEFFRKRVNRSPKNIFGKEDKVTKKKAEKFIKEEISAPGVQVKEERANPLSKYMDDPKITSQKIIEKAGAKFKGITEGEDSMYGVDEPTVWYNDPSGSTHTLRLSEVNEKAVKAKFMTPKPKGIVQERTNPLEKYMDPKGTDIYNKAKVDKVAEKVSNLLKEDSLYHETSLKEAVSFATAHQDKSGLNVASDVDFALGQTGKGAIVEFGTDSLKGDRGHLQGLKKPGSTFVGKEFRLIGGTHTPASAKSITVKGDITDTNRTTARTIKNMFNSEVLSDGTTKLTPKWISKNKVAEPKGIDLGEIIKDAGDAFLPGGLGSGLGNIGQSKKAKEAQRRIFEKHLPALKAEAKRLGMELKAYLEHLGRLTKEQIDDILNLAIQQSPPEKQDFVKPTVEEQRKQIKKVDKKVAESFDPEESPLIKKMVKALKSFKRLRGKQEGIYSAERSKRFAIGSDKLNKKGGHKGLIAFKEALSGELTKVEFESIAKEFTQENLEDLYRMITDNRFLLDTEKLTAAKGLSKILGVDFETLKPISGSTLPQAKEILYMSKVFGASFTQAMLENQKKMEKFWRKSKEVLNLPRAVMASGDLSASGRQGIFLGTRHPGIALKAFAKQFGYFNSKEKFNALQDYIVEHPYYEKARRAGLALTDVGAIMSEREEQFRSNLADKWVPLVARSERAYVGTLNYIRFEVFVKMMKQAEAMGMDKAMGDSRYKAESIRENFETDEEYIKAQKTDKLTNAEFVSKAIADFVNAASGRAKLPGDLERASELLNTMFFSPRLWAGRIQMINPLYHIKNPWFYTEVPSFVRKEANKNLATFVAFGSTMMFMLALAGGEAGTDPLSSDFGKIKFGNTRIDLFAGYQQPARLMAQMMMGKTTSSKTGVVTFLNEGYKAKTRADILLQYVSYKESPILSLLTDYLSKPKYGDYRFNKPNKMFAEMFGIDIPEPLASRFTYMFLQDMFDVIEDDPDKFPVGMLGIFGVGVQTY